MALRRWEVTLSASGEATVTVWAADADAAGEIALKTTPGMTVEGGACDWNIEDARPLEDGWPDGDDPGVVIPPGGSTADEVARD